MLGLLISLKAVGVISVKSKERIGRGFRRIESYHDDLSGYFVPTEWRANLTHVNQKQLAVDNFVCLEKPWCWNHFKCDIPLVPVSLLEFLNYKTTFLRQFF